MLVPNINWIPFDKNNPPTDLHDESDYLIFLREDWTKSGHSWTYSVDIAQPYGSYLDNFWNTTNDWIEGQLIEVLAYAELPYGQQEFDLVEKDTVAIEGFKRPSSCEECKLKRTTTFGNEVCIFHKQFVDDLFLVRHDMCPLREVKGE